MSVNRQVLIKIAAETGYDLTQKFTDGKGRPNKVLVPLDDSRTKPLASHEITAKPLPIHDGPPTDRFLRDSYPYSGYDLYRRQGIITPVKDQNINLDNYKQHAKSTVDTGLLDINKTIASQLGGGPLAESTANALAEYARQKRYNALSSHDKRRYNTVAADTGIKPHAITMLVPGNLSYVARKNLSAPDGVDEDWWGNAVTLHDKRGNPLLYNSRGGTPKFPEGSVVLDPSFFRTMFDTNESPDSKYKFTETYTPNTGFFATNYLNGKIPIVRENFPVNEFIADRTRGSLHSPRLLSTDKDGTTNVLLGSNNEDFNPDYKQFFIPGVNLENIGRSLDNADAADNDFLSNPRDSFKYYALPVDDKSAVNHEAIHAMNSNINSDSALNIKKLDDTIEQLNSRSPFNFIGKMSDLGDLDDTIEELDRISPNVDSTSNGFLDVPSNYVISGGGNEGLRSIVTALRGYQNHLMNVLPAQMEANGELAGLTAKEKNDKIGWRIAELSHNGDNFMNYLRESGIGDGIPTNWRILANSLGGMSGREMNRALEGLDEVMAPKEKMLELLRPEALEKYYNADPDAYKTIQEEYIRQILPYLLHNDTKDVGSDGSVLA